MPKTTLYTMNAAAGAFTAIPATIPCRYVEIREDESVAAQGLIYQRPNLDRTFSVTETVGTPGSPDQPQIILGNKLASGNAKSALLGLPAQNSGGSAIPATTILQIKSKGAGANVIRVIEHE
ncbi:MAG TPA: hypothetical protein VGP89_17990 [Candidatus Angelobacter sp.]|jgi:hypothetical protein|nr:hypothetical protein [Candidatus Angelobacter sp.]